MELPVLVHLLAQASVVQDTVVALMVPPERTAFDYVSGTLQVIVLVVGAISLGALALTALALRKAVQALQVTAERLAADAKPLLHQATRTSEDARDMVKTVRREVDRLASTSADLTARIRDITEHAGDRVDHATALLEVLQDEVEETAISAAAAVRGVRMGALSLGASLAGRALGGKTRDEEEDEEEYEEEEYEEEYDGDDDSDFADGDAEEDARFVDEDDDLPERPRRASSRTRRPR